LTHPRYRVSVSSVIGFAGRVVLSCGLLATGLALGCGSKSERSPALPRSLFETPGEPPKWAEPGDATCGFPSAADAAKIDAAVVVLRVLVGPDGAPKLVQMLEEPGFGFGSAATRCAMARKFEPGSDERGVPVTAWTPPIRIRFLR